MSKKVTAAFCVALAAVGVSAFGAADTAKYNFETSPQGWAIDATTGAAAMSSAKHFAGTSSLAVKVVGAKVNRVSTPKPAVVAGKTVTFHIWVPAKGVTIVQPFVQDKAWGWYGKWTNMAHLKGNAWNTLQVAIPTKAKNPIWKMGVEITGDGKSSPTVYIDSIDW
jgi:hypothetical protein